jgi:ABC-2 type transport system ATP-binding protein
MLYSVALVVVVALRHRRLVPLGRAVAVADAAWVVGTVGLVAAGAVTGQGAALLGLLALPVAELAIGQWRAAGTVRPHMPRLRDAFEAAGRDPAPCAIAFELGPASPDRSTRSRPPSVPWSTRSMLATDTMTRAPGRHLRRYSSLAGFAGRAPKERDREPTAIHLRPELRDRRRPGPDRQHASRAARRPCWCSGRDPGLAMSEQPAVSADALVKRFGDVTALAGVSVDVRQGEVFGYLGRNGSGKTTTVRILTTLTRPTSGTATVAGVRLDQPLEVRRRIGVTLQEAALDPTMTAAEHLVLIGQLGGLGRRRASDRSAELLDTFGLSSDAGRRLEAFSGGMLRRVDIATALISRPTLLFLDEPTTGLDPQSRRALWSEIVALRDQGVTVFLTTQYLEEADELADRLAIIDAGRIIAEGSPASLKAVHGRTTIELTFDGDANTEELAAAVGRTGGGVVVSSTAPRQATLTLAATSGGDAMNVLGRLQDSGLHVTHLRVTESSLEDVFLDLTGTGIAIASNDVNEAVPA